MEKENSNSSIFNRGIQDYLSLGYLYLLVLGIVSDSLHYSFLDINILSYSSITDVLISPVVYLTRSLSFPIFVFLIPGVFYFTLKIIHKRHQKNRDQDWYKEKHDIEELDKRYTEASLTKGFLTLTAITIFSAYLGYGLGSGVKKQDIIQSGKFKTNHTLTFGDGEDQEVYLIGHNSSYVFYAIKNSTHVTVSPIQGNIKRIEKINTK